MKNILITGAAQGIGRSIADTLKNENHLYVIDKQQTEYITENSKSDSFDFFLQDLADAGGLERVINQLKDVEFDAIINNAGEVYLEKWDELKMETWNRTLDVNVTAPLQLIHGLRSNLKSDAAVVNIASVDGQCAAFDTIAYAASKAAIMNLTKSLAAVLGEKGVRVNAVAPGWVETEMTADTLPKEATDMTPLKRNAQAQDVANVVTFLISDKAGFISGETIVVDGGLTVVDYTLKLESGR
jgi:3-oxoacyl-[acyl-carrier protein] reductase